MKSVFCMYRFYAEMHGIKLTKTAFRRRIKIVRESNPTLSQREAFSLGLIL